MPKPIRILGIDPGLRHAGWGLISVEGQAISYVASGVVNPSTKEESLAIRLAELFAGITKVLAGHMPHEVVVEEVFVNKNPASALKLGMARGVILMAPAYAGVPVFEYTANTIKKSVVGAGHADKNQVAQMVRRLLPLSPVDLATDASDALAAALCHASHRTLKRFIAA